MEAPVSVRRVRNKLWRYYEDINDLQSNKIWIFHRHEFEPSLCVFGGLYIMVSYEGDALYVGKSKNLSTRLIGHLDYANDTSYFMDYVHFIIIVKGSTEYENDVIQLLNPIFNTAGKGEEKLYDKLRFIKKHLISEFPEHRDTLVKTLISRNRILEGNKVTDITKYNAGSEISAILDMMSILIDCDEVEAHK